MKKSHSKRGFVLLVSFCFLSNFHFVIAQSNPLDTFPKDKPVPWTNSKFNNHPDQFQFAIVSDRSGGIRKGVFESAIPKLNSLQPEFVMSVGDLIEGVTEDTTEILQEWTEFETMVDQLEMPFFYVPGNHDISNPLMGEIWRKKFGPSYYHFVYKNVLFLCLDTEDQFLGSVGTISTPQYQYFEKILNKNKAVRWTFVFMHQPIWTQKKSSRWQDLEKLLQDRRHTVFAGHRHRFTAYEKHGNNYITLASTGGVSPLRGPDIGEFDHISWVTMGVSEPTITHLLLDGILEKDMHSEAMKEFVDSILTKSFLEFQPLFEEKFSEDKDLSLIIHNPLDVQMSIKLKSRFGWELTGTFPDETIRIPSKEKRTVTLNIRKRKASIKKVTKPLEITALLSFDFSGVSHLKIPVTYFILPEPKYSLAKSSKPKIIDGRLNDWSELPHEVFRKERKDSLDNYLKFNLEYDDQFLYFAALVTDDKLMVDTALKVWFQDCISLVINAQELTESSSRNRWYENELIVRMTPETNTLPSSVFEENKIPEGVQKVCNATTNGYQMEVAIPLEHIRKWQGDDWKHIRINVLVEDYDDPLKKSEERLWFKPNWVKFGNRIGTGLFFKE